MNAEDKREKVIKGLKCLISRDCDICPYDHGFCTSCEKLINDAIELLQQEKAHVMTLNEYKAIAEAPRTEKIPVWIEWFDKRGGGWTIPQIAYENYGITWQAWTGRPNKDQRMEDRKKRYEAKKKDSKARWYSKA